MRSFYPNEVTEDIVLYLQQRKPKNIQRWHIFFRNYHYKRCNVVDQDNRGYLGSGL